ncbi:hypothetical protein BCR44DRAFT_1257207 [Catenaria anguillulae PL171]|uniref:BAR domain-domain-containing protein n=1 Tax=Catenaria anguillulae PL171 TaxID=765915 RepID=A0A1Y2HBF3_9FUNG|nr:hypothetical protein BCR44DRAFT_1257207 [Catenaria anguillulae PL171]
MPTSFSFQERNRQGCPAVAAPSHAHSGPNRRHRRRRIRALQCPIRQLSEATDKLHEDAAKFKKAVEGMLQHQVAFANTLLEVYSPISGRTGSASPTSPDGALGAGSANGSAAVSPSPSHTSLKRQLTPPESIEAVQQYLRSVDAVREPITQELSAINRRIIQPSTDLLDVFKAIRKTITKRNHKLIDFDRYRVDVGKLRAAPQKDAKDERRLITTEQQLQQATHEYNVLNDALKQQLPTFFHLRTAFIDPCFQSLYFVQRKVYAMLTQTLEPMRNMPTLDFHSPVIPRFQAKHQIAENMVNQLTILKFTPAALAAASAAGPAKSPGSTSPALAASSGSAPGGAVPPPTYSTLPVHSTTAYSAPITKSPAYSPPTTAAAAPAMASVVSAAAAASAAPVIKVVTALYDFDGQQADDLPFKTGDRIEVLEATGSTNDWWKGRVRGKVGYFPANYTQ